MVKKAGASDSTKKEHLQWTPSMDKVFIEAMLHEQVQGNRPDGTFTTMAYNNMLKFLRESLELPDLTKNHLKNRIKTLKENFSECYDLFGAFHGSGFAWNPITKMRTAEPSVWNALIAAKPHASKWMSKPINNYDSLEELFAKDRATGEAAETAKEKLKRWAKSSEEDLTINDIDNLVSQNFVSLDPIVDSDGIETSSAIPRVESQSQGDVTSRPKRRRVSTDSNFEEKAFYTTMEKLVGVFSDGTKEMAIALANASMVVSNALVNSNPHVYSASEIYKGLVEMGIPEEELECAYFWLTDNEKMAQKLFGLPLENRKAALDRMMNA